MGGDEMHLARLKGRKGNVVGESIANIKGDEVKK